MHCQTICPENKGPVHWVEAGPTFSEEETGMLLDDLPLWQLPDDLAGKLKTLGLHESLDVLPRNLRALMEPRGLSPNARV
jgi:epoxyqueuosine reductase